MHERHESTMILVFVKNDGGGTNNPLFKMILRIPKM